MQPGRELDALVAEKVMGWERITDGALIWWEKDGKRGHPDSYFNSFPCYSTDISAAWQVVEKIPMTIYAPNAYYANSEYRNNVNWRDEEKGWNWTAEANIPDPKTAFDESVEAQGLTAPHAICLAALKAVEVTF